ncbi:dystonin-like [Platysternon megacephalum]|uniref:Dystonin-like n=1 Tax=Platysternon megacephalum TaxID=55544 RepID=A0A4D9DGB6_9SAUR|nr:dystonin-like [Platysternon megacephalum]
MELQGAGRGREQRSGRLLENCPPSLRMGFTFTLNSAAQKIVAPPTHTHIHKDSPPPQKVKALGAGEINTPAFRQARQSICQGLKDHTTNMAPVAVPAAGALGLK